MGVFYNIIKGFFNSLVIESAETQRSNHHTRTATAQCNRSKAYQNIRFLGANEEICHGDGRQTCQSPIVFKDGVREYRNKPVSTFVPLWKKLGWKPYNEAQNYYVGKYGFFDRKTNRILAWNGAIDKTAYRIKVYIENPPYELQNHKHWQCFTHCSGGWYGIHFLNKIEGLDDAILNVQRLIAEAYWFY
ncbi:MAG: hypothetical protein U9R17_00095 [Thermodesulfobacteriota bacterium]|nr:hypothetical protein [Thermodesulfobacteriota bacterium]